MFIARLIAIGLGLALPGVASAQEACPFGFLSCNPDMSAYIQGVVIGGPRGLQVAFVGVVVAFLIFYAVRLATAGGDENVIGETRAAYAHAIVGAVLVAGAYFIASAFVTGGAVERAPLEGIALQIMIFFKGLVFIVLVGNFFIQGVLLIVAQEDGVRSKARTRMVEGMIGAAIVMLANSAVTAFANRNIGIISRESIGIANFLATIFGLAAVIAIVVAGIFLVVSVDESLKDKAKSLIKASLISLAVIVSSYALVRTFIF